jgi:hypothetical protein
MGRGSQCGFGLGQVVLRRFEFEREFRDLFAQVASLFLKYREVLGFETGDRALVELGDALQISSRLSTKTLEVDAVLSLRDGGSASVKIGQNWGADIGLLECFLQQLFVFLLDDLDLGSENLFLALRNWSAFVKQ